MAQWITVLSRNIKVAGSSPAVSNVLCPWAKPLYQLYLSTQGLNDELLGICARLSPGCTMGYPIWVAVIIVKRFETYM